MGKLRTRLLALVCMALAIGGGLSSSGVAETTRVERKPYVLGADGGAVCAAPVVGEVPVGGACFDLRPTDRFMTIEIAFSRDFGTVEGAVVRGHAVAYATP